MHVCDSGTVHQAVPGLFFPHVCVIARFGVLGSLSESSEILMMRDSFVRLLVVAGALVPLRAVPRLLLAAGPLPGDTFDASLSSDLRFSEKLRLSLCNVLLPVQHVCHTRSGISHLHSARAGPMFCPRGYPTRWPLRCVRL